MRPAAAILVPAILTGLAVTSLPAQAAPEDDLTAILRSIRSARSPLEADRAYTRGRQRAPEAAALHRAHMRRMIQLASPGAGAVSAERLVDLDPSSAVAWGLLGYVRARDGDYPEALALTVRAAALAPENIGIANNAGQLLGWYDTSSPRPEPPAGTRLHMTRARARLEGSAIFEAAYRRVADARGAGKDDRSAMRREVSRLDRRVEELVDRIQQVDARIRVARVEWDARQDLIAELEERYEELEDDLDRLGYGHFHGFRFFGRRFPVPRFRRHPRDRAHDRFDRRTPRHRRPEARRREKPERHRRRSRRAEAPNVDETLRQLELSQPELDLPDLRLPGAGDSGRDDSPPRRMGEMERRMREGGRMGDMERRMRGLDRPGAGGTNGQRPLPAPRRRGAVRRDMALPLERGKAEVVPLGLAPVGRALPVRPVGGDVVVLDGELFAELGRQADALAELRRSALELLFRRRELERSLREVVETRRELLDLLEGRRDLEALFEWTPPALGGTVIMPVGPRPHRDRAGNVGAEAEAASKLSLARTYLSNGAARAGERILREIVTDYDFTASATKARKLLERLKE